MGCKVCWTKPKFTENGIYSCTKCVDTEPWPRFRISVRAIDIEAESEHDPTFAEFGQQGELITGTTAECVATHAKGRADYLPSELEKLHGKKFIVTVTPSEQSLEADFFYFKVQATEHLENEAPLAYYQ